MRHPRQPRIVYTTDKEAILRQVKAGGKTLGWVLDTLLRTRVRKDRTRILQEWSEAIARIYGCEVHEVRAAAVRRGWI